MSLEEKITKEHKHKQRGVRAALSTLVAAGLLATGGCASTNVRRVAPNPSDPSNPIIYEEKCPMNDEQRDFLERYLGDDLPVPCIREKELFLIANLSREEMYLCDYKSTPEGFFLHFYSAFKIVYNGPDPEDEHLFSRIPIEGNLSIQRTRSPNKLDADYDPDQEELNASANSTGSNISLVLYPSDNSICFGDGNTYMPFSIFGKDSSKPHHHVIPSFEAATSDVHLIQLYYRPGMQVASRDKLCNLTYADEK